MRPVSICAGSAMNPALRSKMAARCLPTGPKNTTVATAISSATLASIRLAVGTPVAAVAPASDQLTQHIQSLQERQRSVSATIKRLKCEQEMVLANMRREREVGRLQARLARTSGSKRLPLDCAADGSSRSERQ